MEKEHKINKKDFKKSIFSEWYKKIYLQDKDIDFGIDPNPTEQDCLDYFLENIGMNGFEKLDHLVERYIQGKEIEIEETLKEIKSFICLGCFQKYNVEGEQQRYCSKCFNKLIYK